MKNTRVYLFICLTIFSLLLLSCSKGVQKSPLQLEADKQAEQWFNSSFAKCGNTYATKYNGIDLAIGLQVLSMKEGFIQIKNLSYVVEEQALTESDKLNGVEWKGSLILQPIKPALRYFDLTSYSYSKKWSEWMEETLIYNRSYSLPNASKSPFLRDFKKVKGSWEGLTKSDFNKIECSELPPS